MLGNKPKVQYLDVVDESGRVIGKDTRENLHKNPKAIHPTVNMLIVNSKNEFLVHLRSFRKKENPGLWEISSAGHIDSGEKPFRAACRELLEELGIKVGLKFIDKKVFRFDNESELAHLYFGKSDGPFKINKAEIEEIRFVKYKDLKDFLRQNREKSMLEYWLPAIEKHKDIIFN
jgi:isopentenyl-diphosphate delta-isomerase